MEPIPLLCEPPGWGRVPIREVGEPLVPLEESAQLRVRPIYHSSDAPPAALLVREQVRARLRSAALSLPRGIALVVLDGYRSLEVQRRLYEQFRAQIAAALPGADDAAIAWEVGKFVAYPSSDPLRPPPHLTGGAVDVCLLDVVTEAALDMGTPPDALDPRSTTRYYELHPEEPYTENRRLLYHAMIGTGFANYHGEWWHYEFGNQRWANCTGSDFAFYGQGDRPGA